MLEIFYGKLIPNSFIGDSIINDEDYCIMAFEGKITLVYKNPSTTNKAVSFNNKDKAKKIANEILSFVSTLEKIEQHNLEVEKIKKDEMKKHSPKCLYSKAWVGSCGKPSAVNEVIGLCEEHSQIKCTVCKEQAFRECSQTNMLVCGCPLCDNPKCWEEHNNRSHKWGHYHEF